MPSPGMSPMRSVLVAIGCDRCFRSIELRSQNKMLEVCTGNGRDRPEKQRPLPSRRVRVDKSRLIYSSTIHVCIYLPPASMYGLLTGPSETYALQCHSRDLTRGQRHLQLSLKSTCYTSTRLCRSLIHVGTRCCGPELVKACCCFHMLSLNSSALLSRCRPRVSFERDWRGLKKKTVSRPPGFHFVFDTGVRSCTRRIS